MIRVTLFFGKIEITEKPRRNSKILSTITKTPNINNNKKLVFDLYKQNIPPINESCFYSKKKYHYLILKLLNFLSKK